MTVRKSKGKEFDEVVIYDGLFQGIVRDPSNEKAVAQNRLALRVTVTHAIKRANILIPKKNPCPFL